MPIMKDLDIDFISLVNKGANKQTVKIYKSDKEPVNSNEEEFRGFFNVIKSFFTTKEKQQIQEIKKSKEDEAMKPDDIKKMIDEALNPIMDEIKVLTRQKKNYKKEKNTRLYVMKEKKKEKNLKKNLLKKK